MIENVESLEFRMISERFNSALENLSNGEKNNDNKAYEDSIKDLDPVVETLLINFYNLYIEDFSEEEYSNIEKIIKKFDRKTFNKLPLGLKMNFFRENEGFSDDLNFIEKVEKKENFSLENLKRLRDGDFVEVRNCATHIDITQKKLIIDKDIAIKQFNLVSAVLIELGYEGFYDYEINKYNKFVDKFKKIENIFQPILNDNFKIEPELLSDFKCDSKPIDLISELHRTKDNILIIGEGGIGKSTIIRYIQEKYFENNKLFQKKPFIDGQEVFFPIPILISASKLKVSALHLYEMNDFIDDIIRLYQKNSINIIEEAKELSSLYEGICEKNTNPFFILLIDGFNEINDLNDENRKGLISIFKNLLKYNIQIVVSSRGNIFFSDDNCGFKEVYAEGVNSEKIERYIHSDPEYVSSVTMENKLSDKNMYDILKNPMLLLLYTGYQDKKYSSLSNSNVEKLQDTNKLNPIENNCRTSFILWNYIQYNILYDNIYRPLIEEKQSEYKKLTEIGLEIKEREQDIYARIICELVPEIAWEMVSKGLFQIKRFDSVFKDCIINFCNSLDISIDVIKVIDFLIDSICLLKYENDNISFGHQNFRDFFAACHYVNGYKPLQGINKNEEKFQEYLKIDFIPSDIKIYVGELLTELEDNQDPLKIILKKYQNNNSVTVNDHTVENIFEIYKSLNIINPIDFIDTDLDRLNFNDVAIDKIIQFVKDALNTISVDVILSELQLFGKNKNYGSIIRLKSIFMLSARCACNLNKYDLEKFYNVWYPWASNVYRNNTKIPVKSLVGKLTYKVLSNKDLSNFLLTNVLYSFLANENVGIGKKGFLNIFTEVSDLKSDYQKLMEMLEKEGNGIDNSIILEPMFNLASRNDYAANFVCFLLDYYLFYNLEDGLELIKMMWRKREVDKPNFEKETLLKFRMMSGMNYCVQESLCHKKYEKDVLSKKFKYQMNEILDLEFKNFSPDIANDYKNFKFGYYFPFGIQYSFDNGIDEDTTTKKAIEEIFPREGNSINLLLFQKVIFDIACVSTSTFFMQDEFYNEKGVSEFHESRYLGKTYKFFENIIFKFYPIDPSDSPYAFNEAAWESLIEALAILSFNYPLKTEKFLDSINKKYLDNNKKFKIDKNNKVFALKNKIRRATEENFNYLCNAELNEKKLTIKEFLENYKNVLVFADLANNVFISFPNITKSLVNWGNTSFYKNIDVYTKNPKKFVSKTIDEVVSLF